MLSAPFSNRNPNNFSVVNTHQAQYHNYNAQHQLLAASPSPVVATSRGSPNSSVAPSPINANATVVPANGVEIFVGNLSYFCEESHLFALFNEYFQVVHVRIMRNDDRSRSLMYGFVAACSYAEALEMCRLMNGHLFMGRNIK